MKINRLCPECGSKSCKIDLHTLLYTVYCTKCFSKLEYSKNCRGIVGFISSIGFVITLITLIKTENLLFALEAGLLVLLPTLYVAVRYANLKLSGQKALRKRIREKLS